MTQVRTLPRSHGALALLALLGGLLVQPAAARQVGAATQAAVAPVVDTAVTASTGLARVVVQAVPGSLDEARADVLAIGGEVGASLPIIDGFAAAVPAARAAALSASRAIRAVTPDSSVRFNVVSYTDTGTASSFTKSSGATQAWTQGRLGAGVGVAVIDTGISPINDLSGRVVSGPDLSGEGTLVDTYGHGTVMAGVIGGSGADSAGNAGGAYTGVAPKATLVGVKVAGRNGAADVSTMLAAMHWVSAYKDQFNIRVLNLSWGTPSTQSPSVDPLNYAVQRLWQQGIVVVVSAGNAGPSSTTIAKPADDPVALTVGAFDDKGTESLSDDSLPAWTSRGPTAQGLTKPDVVAPGRLVVSTRSPGSTVEGENPKALFPPSYIRGSGSSQAAAVTSGLVALLLEARPGLTPDQVKSILMRTASSMGRSAYDQGAGRVQLGAALAADAGPAKWQSVAASGLGSLEQSRGGLHVQTDCQPDGILDVIQGEVTDRCQVWDGNSWTGNSWTGNSWTGNSWTGNSWTGNSWTGNSWTNAAWTGNSWTGGTWTGNSWTGNSWTGNAWTGNSWTGNSWTGNAWSGNAWSGNSWTNAEYALVDDGIFMTAFYGRRPPWWVRLPGEVSDSGPVREHHSAS